jgi:hypothetical protein
LPRPASKAACGGHGHLSTQLQSLLREVDGASGAGSSASAGLASNSSGTHSQGVSNLETSFQSLMQDLSASAATGQSASQTSTPSLQNFLQTLLGSLQTQGSTQSAGLLIHATA